MTGSFFLIATILPVLACTPHSQMNQHKTNIDGPPLATVDLDEITDAKPRYEPLSFYGNPQSYTIRGQKYRPQQERTHYQEEGIASWYGKKFHGRLTSNQEPYDMLAMTAAHKTLPLPSYVTVTNLLNGKKIIVRVNDRGPFAEDRIIDLSYVAAAKLGIIDPGIAPVTIETILPRPSDSDLEKNHQQKKIYIQTGAFTERHRAITLSNKLNRLITTKITSTDKQGKILYRVHSGPFASPAEARNTLKKLSKKGYHATIIFMKSACR